MGMAKKLADRFRNLRLLPKFLLILALAMALVCTSTFAALRIPYAAYDEQLYRSCMQMMAVFAGHIQDGLAEIEELSFRILADNVLQESLTTMADKPVTTASWGAAKNAVGDRMAYFSMWFSHARSLQLETADGQDFTQGFGQTSVAHEISEERIALAHGSNGREVWLLEEKSARLFLLREIREVHHLSLRPLATILIEMDLNGLVETQRQNMHWLNSPLSCAIYSGDVCLYSSDERVRGLSPAGEDGYQKISQDGQAALCVRFTADNGWRYVTLVDYSVIEATVRAAERITMGVIVTASLLALVLSAWMIASLLKHLKILLHKFDAFAADGVPVPETPNPYQSRKDEIGQLHRHFDRMTREYDRITRENAEKQQLLQEKQMQQLRAQVRPHFLYNTLESIYCLAIGSEDKRIATMTNALGKMLRASLNDKRDVVTVGEDLQIARECLHIQLLRYGDRLRVEEEIAESFLSCQIPAMTIQPLVENAVHHAAEEMLEICTIRLGARTVDGDVEILVEDNGPGMDEDILEKLESGAIKPEGLGIGMRNIHRRVQYAFSSQYGLRVKSTPGHTQIIIRLPDTRGGSRGQAFDA